MVQMYLSEDREMEDTFLTEMHTAASTTRTAVILKPRGTAPRSRDSSIRCGLLLAGKERLLMPHCSIPGKVLRVTCASQTSHGT